MANVVSEIYFLVYHCSCAFFRIATSEFMEVNRMELRN